jgi:hypothetical protein
LDNYNDEVFDITIKHAGREVLRDIYKEAEALNKTHLSEDLDRRIKRLIKGSARKKRVSRILKVSTRVAAVLVLFIIISTAVFFSSEAMRVKVMNLFTEKAEGHVDLQFFEIEDGLPKGMIVPEYIPKGFTLKKAYKNSSWFISEYQNSSNNVIRVQQGSYLTSVTVDDDGLGSYETDIMGKKAYVAVNKAVNSIYFNSNSYGFVIYTDMDPSELIKIAESILRTEQE